MFEQPPHRYHKRLNYSSLMRVDEEHYGNRDEGYEGCGANRAVLVVIRSHISTIASVASVVNLILTRIVWRGM